MLSGIITSLLVDRPIVPPGQVIKNSLPTNNWHALDSVIIIRIHGGQPTTSASITNRYYKNVLLKKMHVCN